MANPSYSCKSIGRLEGGAFASQKHCPVIKWAVFPDPSGLTFTHTVMKAWAFSQILVEGTQLTELPFLKRLKYG